MTSPLPDHATHAPQTTAHHHPKGSDHDRNHHHGAKEDGRTDDGRTNGCDTSAGDRIDSEEGGRGQSDTDRPQRPRQRTAARRPQRAVGDSTPSTPDHPTERASSQGDGRAAPVVSQALVRLTAGPDGALWVAVDGTDIQQVASRINAACEVLIRGRSSGTDPTTGG